MKVVIRDPNKNGSKILAETEVTNLYELDMQLQEHGLVRDIKDLREDLKWDCANYSKDLEID